MDFDYHPIVFSQDRHQLQCFFSHAPRLGRTGPDSFYAVSKLCGEVPALCEIRNEFSGFWSKVVGYI